MLSPASRCCPYALSGATACWLLPLLVHLGLSAARRPALAGKGWPSSVGFWGDMTAACVVYAQAGWLLDGRIGQGCLLGTSVGCHASVSTVLFLRIILYDVRLGGCGCLLRPTLQRYRVKLFGS